MITTIQKHDHHGTISQSLNNENMRAMTKSQLAKKAGVQYKVFQRWLQDPEIQNKLASCHLKPKQQILPPAAVQIIAEHYVIEID